MVFQPSDEGSAAVVAIAFAALIHVYGKPIEIMREEVDALPEVFTVEVEQTERGRRFSVKERKE